MIMGMSKRIFDQADRLTERNRQIWLARACGATLAQIGAAHGMSVSNVHRIVEQVAADMPAEGKSVLIKLTVESYDKIDRELWKIALAPGKQRIAPNGKPIYDADGVPELDNTEKLAAIDRLLKSQLQRTKLFGIEVPTQQVQVSSEPTLRERQDAYEILKKYRERQAAAVSN